MLVTSVCSLKGGVGKTSVVLGLASAAFARGLPTLVVDLDPQGDATMGLDVVTTGHGDVADVLASPRRRAIEGAIAPSGWVPEGDRVLDVMIGSARSAAHDSPAPTPKAIRQLDEALRRVEGYELVLIDCPPSINALTRTALVASRRAAVVTEPGLFSVSAADRALRAMDELRRGPAPDLSPLGLIVNRVRPRSAEHDYRIAELKQMFGPLVLSPALPERSVLQQAQGAGRPIHSWAGQPAEELSADFDRLLERVLRSGRTGSRRR